MLFNFILEIAYYVNDELIIKKNLFIIIILNVVTNFEKHYNLNSHLSDGDISRTYRST